ncbi:hypothetical protein PG993_010873 [Apiospora rasikravindrae]|uniref:2EXR domain-containing protein n=1 Tax=Apiospora rasikravindrae TaxID=990691 RepID=A0ABR1SCM0_9PEZI
MGPEDTTYYRPPVYTPDKEHRYPGDCLPGDPSPPFTRFLEFPAEIQLLIWEHAAAAPTILQLDATGIAHFESGLLTACTASREAFLNFPGTVRSRHGLGGAYKGPCDDCHSQRPRKGQHGVWWLGHIAGAGEIRHLAIHYDSFNAFAKYRHEKIPGNAAWDYWLTKQFPRLRTWEIYAEWIESLDQQRAAGDGRSTKYPGIVYIPTMRKLPVSTVSQLLMHLHVDKVKSVKSPPHEPKLLGRPIIHVDREALERYPWWVDPRRAPRWA